jgi:hypothetical protein
MVFGLNQQAVAQLVDAVEPVVDFLVVGDGDDRCLLFGGKLAQQNHDDARPGGIERRRGLVG